MKFCTKCRVMKDFDAFCRHPKSADGRQPSCKACALIRVLQFTRAHPERVREHQHRTYEKRKVEVLSRQAKYYQTVKAERSARRKEETRLRQTRRAADRPRLLTERKKKRAAYAIDYVQANREKVRATRDAYRLARLPYFAAKQTAREARKRALIIGDQGEVLAFYELVRTAPLMSCRWCEAEVPLRKRHVDHIIPLSRGGPHSIENLCCSCATCNTRKGAKMPSEFIAMRERVA